MNELSCVHLFTVPLGGLAVVPWVDPKDTPTLEDETDFFDSNQVEIDMNKAIEAAWKAKAKSWLEHERTVAVAKGDDPRFIDNLMADLDKFVKEHKDELDLLLAEEEGGKVGVDEMDVDKKKKKRTVIERDDNGTGDEAMN